MRNIVTYCVLVILIAQIHPTAASEPCIKKVVQLFCLGGKLDELPLDAKNQHSDADDLQYAVSTFEYADKTLRVTSRDGIITTIARLEPPGSWLNYTKWKKRIVRQYGQGIDQSTLPPYATSRSSRRNAISAGRGYAAMLWQQPGWQLTLIWADTSNVELHYILAPADASREDEL